MCISALIEADLQKIAALLGLSSLTPTTPAAPNRRVESRQTAWVMRASRTGQIIAEPMRFNPYIVNQAHLDGDMWASSLLGSNHGIVVMRGYSDWVAASALVASGLIGSHEVHCAFNRIAAGGRGEERRLLVNFSPSAPLLVPVLFDRARMQVVGQDDEREFVVLSGQPPGGLTALGLTDAPLDVPAATALDWLHTQDLDLETFDCAALLAELKPTACALALYKSA